MDIFLGGGGVGKSFLIDLIAKWTHKILTQPGDIADHPKVIKMAPTGVAAYVIGIIFLLKKLIFFNS